MRNVSNRVERARNAVQVHWSPERAVAVEQSMLRRARRRARARVGVAALVLAASAGFFARRLLVDRTPSGATTIATSTTPRSAEGAWEPLIDGSRVALRSHDARYEVHTGSNGAIDVRLLHGGARFDVVHRTERVFRVDAGNVAVVVLGTQFTVDRDAGTVRVAVQSGRVRVVDASHTVDLAAGESIALPTRDDAPRAPVVAATAEDPMVPAPSREHEHVASTPRPLPPPHDAAVTPAPPVPETVSWAALARSGDYDRAYEALHGSSDAAVRDDAGELLLAADAARLSHHAAESLPYLRGVLDRHASDPRAPLAAFSLGRVLLDDLGDPRRAAEAFARSAQLDPNGSLAEDALAREVESLSRAGDADAARAAATRYIERYPSGRRLAAVRRFGGVSP